MLNTPYVYTIERRRICPRLRYVLEAMGTMADMPNMEHFMTALLRETDCDVTKALNAMGVTEETFNESLEKIRGPEPMKRKKKKRESAGG